MADADVVYDPFSIEAMTDPLPLYASLRSRSGPYRLDRYNAWALSRFADVWDVFTDLDDFSIVEGPIFDVNVLAAGHRSEPPKPDLDPMPGFVSLDPPLHTQLRQALSGPLRPRPVSQLEGDIRRLARLRLEELEPRGRFDVRGEYAGPVSAGVMCLIVGFPLDSAPLVQQLANASLRRASGRPGVAEEGLRARAELDELLLEAIRARRGVIGDGSEGLLDRLLTGTFAGRSLRDEEVVTQVRAIVSGGIETVPKVIAAGLLELWRHPDQRLEVGRDPERCTVAFEEMVRYHGPLQWVGRTLVRDRVVAGTRMRAGERVLLLIASANRDEREFADPDEFRWNRPMPRHLGFGQGHHYCIGTHVARLEGRVLLEELLARVPDYNIDASHLDRTPSEFQVGFVQMPLIVSDRG
jgi:cytochrome P450